MSTFKDLTSNRPATMGAVLRAIARMRKLDETQIQHLAAAGKMREHFAFALDTALPEDFVDEERIPEASPYRPSAANELALGDAHSSDVEEESKGAATITPSFVQQHYSSLRSLLTRRTQDSAVATEMVNEAIVIAMSHLRVGQITEPRDLSEYIYRIALNLYRVYRRKFTNRRDLRVEAVLSQQELEAMLAEMRSSKSEALDLHCATKGKASS